MKLGIKLILGFLVVVLISLGIGIFSLQMSQRELQKSIGDNSVVLAQETMDKIDRNMYSKIELWQAYTNDLILQGTVIASNQEFGAMENRQSYIQQKDAEWISASKGTITSFMQEIFSTKLSDELREKIEFYEEKYGYAVFPEAYVTNKHGVIIASTGRTSDYLQADEEWYQTAVKEENFWVGEVEYDESSDAYASDIVVNLYDEKGNFAGILKAVLNIEEIINILKELEPETEEEHAEHEAHGHEEHETKEFKLLTKDGKTIYSTEDFEIFEEISGELLSQFKQEGEHIHYFVGSGDMPGEGEELFAHAHSEGYRDLEGLGWILIIEHETDEIFAPITNLRNITLIVSGIIAIIAIIIGLFFSRSITKPITKLKESADKISKGNLGEPIEVRSKDEIGELAESFDNMRYSLRMVIDEYEKMKGIEKPKPKKSIKKIRKPKPTKPTKPIQKPTPKATQKPKPKAPTKKELEETFEGKAEKLPRPKPTKPKEPITPESKPKEFNDNERFFLKKK